jgi:hypothetical protein
VRSTLVSRAAVFLSYLRLQHFRSLSRVVCKFLSPQLCKISKMSSSSAKSAFDFLRLVGELAKNCGRAPARKPPVGKYPFFDTLLSVGCRRRCCIKKRITGNLNLTASVQE